MLSSVRGCEGLCLSARDSQSTPATYCCCEPFCYTLEEPSPDFMWGAGQRTPRVRVAVRRPSWLPEGLRREAAHYFHRYRHRVGPPSVDEPNCGHPCAFNFHARVWASAHVQWSRTSDATIGMHQRGCASVNCTWLRSIIL